MRALVLAVVPCGLLALIFAGYADGAGGPQADAGPLAPAAVRKRIQEHRTAEATLTVLGADGKPLANTPAGRGPGVVRAGAGRGTELGPDDDPVGAEFPRVTRG
jgi:hypothetical protein